MIGGSYDGYSVGAYYYDTSAFKLRYEDVELIYWRLLGTSTDQEFHPTAPAIVSLSEYNKTIKVKFENTDDNKTVYIPYDSSYPFPSATPPKDHYFDRWEREETDGFKKLTVNTVNVDYDHTVRAVYQENGCVTGGTEVTMADGTVRNIEDVRIGDMLMAFDHMSGTWVSTPVINVFSMEEGDYTVLVLHFSDGSSVNVYQAHGFFDIDTNRYEMINLGNAGSYVGDRFVKTENGILSYVELVSYEDVIMTTTVHSVITASCINCLCQGMLSVPDDIDGLYNIFDYGEDLGYDPEDVASSLDLYGYGDYSDWEQYLSEEEFYAFNGQYVNVMIGKGLVTQEGIMHLIDLLREGS